nr:MAG TPA_asm: AAA domain protein [Caudoviricetes sp.]
MAVLVMVYGHSGSGKSASLRNFAPEQVAVINVLGKPLPFRSNMKTYITNNYDKIDVAIHSTKRKSIVIDDATYLMTGEFMRNAKVAGFQKFTDMAANFNTLLMRAKELPDDVVVYFFGHSERDGDGGEKFKTIGKLLDEKVCVEGYFTIVLKTVVQDGRYLFSTRNDGMDTVKTPLGMFNDALIENDLAAVDKTIREYYNIPVQPDNKGE